MSNCTAGLFMPRFYPCRQASDNSHSDRQPAHRDNPRQCVRFAIARWPAVESRDELRAGHVGRLLLGVLHLADGQGHQSSRAVGQANGDGAGRCNSCLSAQSGPRMLARSKTWSRSSSACSGYVPALGPGRGGSLIWLWCHLGIRSVVVARSLICCSAV